MSKHRPQDARHGTAKPSVRPAVGPAVPPRPPKQQPRAPAVRVAPTAEGEPSVDLTINGNVRRLAARWVITGTLRLITAAHFGGEEDGPADLTLLRDRLEGGPLLTGASLGGALRSHLNDRLSGFASSGQEPPAVARLFGAGRADDAGVQSSLVIFDSIGRLPDGLAVEIRDGVSIDAASGTAADHKKFDLEVLPKGTTFPLRFDLLVPDKADELALLGGLAAALDGLAPGAIRLGARRSRGLGAVETREWRARRFDLHRRDGWLDWALTDHMTPLSATLPDVTLAAALGAAWPDANPTPLADNRRRVLATLSLRFSGGLLVRSPASDPGGPDVAHLHSAGTPVLPGTSLAGVLRARALRVARLVRAENGDGEQWVERLFGPHLGTGTSSVQPSASRLRVAEAAVQEGAPMRPTRVRIDRFSQGTVPTALFDEEPWYAGRVETVLELRNPHSGEVGLFLLLIKDLLTGDMPVGGSGGVGHGALTGTGLLDWPDGTSTDLALPARASREATAALDAAIGDFWNAPSISQPSMDVGHGASS